MDQNNDKCILKNVYSLHYKDREGCSSLVFAFSPYPNNKFKALIGKNAVILATSISLMRVKEGGAWYRRKWARGVRQPQLVASATIKHERDRNTDTSMVILAASCWHQQERI